MEKNATGNWDRFKSVYLFLISLGFALVLTFLLTEPGFSDSQRYMIFLLFFAVGLWVTEAIPAFAVSLLIISFLVFALGNKYFNSEPENIEPYVQTLSDSTIWLLLGGFFLAKAMAKTKLDETLFRSTLKVAGTNPRNILIGLMVTTMFASMLLSNTATTTMVLVAIMPLIKSLDQNPAAAKAFLLAIPVASTAGGIATIVGTPANAIAVGALNEAGTKIEFLDWMMYGVPIAFVLTTISCLVLMRTYLKDTMLVPTVSVDDRPRPISRKLSSHRKIVIAVIVVTVGLWVTSSLHGIKAASVCAIPLVVLTLTGVLNSKDVQQLPWDTLLLIAGGLSLGLGLEHSGLLDHYAKILMALNLNSLALIFVFGFLAVLLATVMTNTTATALMIPVCTAILPAFQLEVSVIVAISSSTALALLASSPSNAIVFDTGYLKQKDFRLNGILIGVLGPLLTILWVLFRSS